MLFTFQLRAQVKLITLSQLQSRIANGKDTTYVINFWATWCKPCVKELPEFEKFKQANKGKPVKVIMVSTDLKSRLQQSVNPFVKSHGLTGDVYLLNEAPSSYYSKVNSKWSGALPATWVLNTNKKRNDFYNTDFTLDRLNTVVEKR